MLLRLSSTASKVLMYSLTMLDKFTKRIEILTPLCMSECGFKTRKSVVDGICELLEKEILIRTSEPMTYWINPMIVFNGDRMEFIREYILE